MEIRVVDTNLNEFQTLQLMQARLVVTMMMMMLLIVRLSIEGPLLIERASTAIVLLENSRFGFFRDRDFPSAIVVVDPLLPVKPNLPFYVL